MPGYLLVRANNLYGAYVEGQTPPLIQKKGAIIEVRHTDDGHGAAEILPALVRIEVSDGMVADLEPYQDQWVKSIDWEVVSSDTVLDSYRLNIASTNSGGGEGATSFVELQKILIDWNAVFVSEAENLVVVDMTVFNAIVSQGFWERDAVEAIIFTEADYNQATGMHTISANYSVISMRASGVDKLIRKKGGVIISHEANIIFFTIQRNVVIQAFKTELKRAGESKVRVNRFRVSTDIVDEAIALGGATITALIDLQAGIIDDSA